ncbi:MAG: HAD family hydrolase [Sphaerochaetaceae bacterium]|nr:HAD family hydrolase [Sphaerochaetaceae bacterium]
MSRKKAVLFDLDGTLLDTISDICSAMNRTLGTSITDSQCKNFVGRGLRNALKDGMRFSSIEVPSSGEEFEKIYSVFENNYADRPIEKTVPYEGITDVLEELHRRGIKMGVFSAKEQPLAEYVISHTLPDVFCFIAGLHGKYEGKPSVQAPEAFMELCGINRDELVYAGDGETDWKTGCNTGCKTVMVTWGFRTREQLLSSGVPSSVMVSGSKELLSELLSD